jgi:hypothetical protein
MKNRILVASLLVLLSVAVPLVAAAEEPSASHLQAAEELFGTMEMSALMDKSLDAVIKAQVAANPPLAKAEDVLRQFMSKYLSWRAVKPQMLKIYTETFTESELREINAFYRTPTGKKAVTVMPDLLQKGMALGQKSVQDHIGELQEAVEKAMKGDEPKKP